MVVEGQPFPEFRLLDQDGKFRTLAEFKGSPTIVYFYPKDDTSGCTTEACGFQESLPRFKGVPVIGVSPDSVKSHRKFADKYGLDFVLLSDDKQELAKAVGVWVEKSMYGRQYMGIERTTFLLDADGTVSRVWRKVKPAGHPDEVIEALRS